MTDLFGNEEVTLERKVEQSLRLIRSVCKMKGDFRDRLIGGMSGGKDSAVVYDLVMQVDNSVPFYYANTTIDPPGTMKFIREYYPNVEILQPKKGYFTLVREKGLPTRQARYCCELLKEYVGVGKNMFEGIRSEESRNREGRDYIQCDSRTAYKGGQHIYPIYDWTERDVWEYIDKRGIKTNPNYKRNGGCMERIGCVGCPLGGRYQRALEFQHFPKYLEANRLAIKHGMENNPQWKLTQLSGGDADAVMKWWLNGRKSMEEWFSKPTNTLFDDEE
jgi:phosphoadenosine phosphosulfate reductase